MVVKCMCALYRPRLCPWVHQLALVVLTASILSSSFIEVYGGKKNLNSKKPSADATNAATAPVNVNTAATTGFISDYHFPMVADEVRNMLFYEALRKAIVPNVSSVLDVGAGSSLLSMMALELGARSVLGVEADPTMINLAKEVIWANGFANQFKTGKIRFFEGNFEDLRLGHKSLKNPVDVLVSETFDSALIGERFLSVLSHAKTSGVLKPSATIIPHSAQIVGQLLESTFSLPKGENNTDFRAAGGRFTLEPMRKFRPARGFTVRYLGEQNAVRRTLSDVTPMFDFDFQNFDPVSGNFAYACIIFRVSLHMDDKAEPSVSRGSRHAEDTTTTTTTATAGSTVVVADVGVFDSIGFWFNLYLDKDRELVLSNAPAYHHTTSKNSENKDEIENERKPGEIIPPFGGNIHKNQSPQLSPCWMQAIFRVSQDVIVRHGDTIRVQIVHTMDKFVFGDVGIGGVHNADARLVRFNAVNCVEGVDVYSYRPEEEEEEEEEEEGEEREYELFADGSLESDSSSIRERKRKRRKAREHVGEKSVTKDGDEGIDKKSAQKRRGKSHQTGNRPMNLQQQQQQQQAAAFKGGEEYWVGKIAPISGKTGSTFAVFPARVGQQFKLVTRLPSTGKVIGMYYELPDSTADIWGSKRARARRKIPLDSFDIVCPT